MPIWALIKTLLPNWDEETKAYNEKILNEWNNGRGGYSDVLSRPVILYYKGASTTALYAVRSEGIDPMNGKERFLKKNGMSTYTWDANDQVVVGDNNRCSGFDEILMWDLRVVFERIFYVSVGSSIL